MKTVIVGLGFVEQHLNQNYERSAHRFEPTLSSVERFLDLEMPDVVINCLGKTGRPNIDECEAQKGDTLIKNVTIPTLLAEATERRGIRLLHIGSGCIFSGPSPSPDGWNEGDIANPQSFYSKTKYSCDLAIADLSNVCILRIRMPVSDRYLPRNFITKVIGYSSIIDIPNSMTFMRDFSRAVDWAVDNSKSGVYHVTNPGLVTAADFVREYAALTPHTYRVIDESELRQLTTAPRSNCQLDSSKIVSEGFQFNHSSQLIKPYVTQYLQSKLEKINHG